MLTQLSLTSKKNSEGIEGRAAFAGLLIHAVQRSIAFSKLNGALTLSDGPGPVRDISFTPAFVQS